jgi:inorganic phosphate transporter, PiT family
LESLLLQFSIAMAILFAFLNGYHDGSNVVATSILSRSVSAGKALLLASLAELAGALLLGSAVARTIWEIMGPVFFRPGMLISSVVLFSAVGGMIIWSPMAWWVGIPPSSTHALLGGLLGATLAGMGAGFIDWVLFLRLILLLLAAPAAGALAGLTLAFFLRSKKGEEFASKPERLGRVAGLLFIGMCHGTNNAQKEMALITLALIPAGSLAAFDVPAWVSLVCGSSLGLGVYFGGWNIVRILGNRIFRIRPIHSFLSQALTAAILLASTFSGSPVNGVEVVKATIAGLGGGKRTGSVYRSLSRDIILALVVTLPSSALLAAAIYWIVSGALEVGIGRR